MVLNRLNYNVPYYEDMTRISNSNIGWFMKKGPRYLKDMLEGKAEGIKGNFLEKGTMIHEYLLQPEEFWKDYVILDFEVPRVKQQKEFLETYNKLILTNPLESQDKLKLQAYKSAYSNKKSDDKCLEEAQNIIEVYQDYLGYLAYTSANKKIISYANLNMLKTIKKNIDEHKKANELFNILPQTYEVMNELHINWELIISCKSLLDRVMVDFQNKKIILIDIKTTADVYNFKHSIEEFDYCRQLAFYWSALSWYFTNVLGLIISDFEQETYIVAIQSHDGYEVRVFSIDPISIRSRINDIHDTLLKIEWHKQNNKWDHTKEYYLGDGTEYLCL